MAWVLSLAVAALCLTLAIGACVDDDANCPAWATDGQCDANPGYMHVHCKLSCKTCDGAGTDAGHTGHTGGACADDVAMCTAWAAGDQCTANPGYMLIHCKKSCNSCGGAGTGGGTTGGTTGSCTDSNASCASWAGYGECKNNPVWMAQNCQKSCNTCGGAGTGGGTTGGTTGSCTDSNASCAGWAAAGECKNNPVWMAQNCQKSCNTCGGAGTGGGTTGSCTDSNANCASWAGAGECQNNPGWMTQNCQKSCNTCGAAGTGGGTTGSCTDSNANCAMWAGAGECQKNPGWMPKNCRKSCNTCGGAGTGSGGTGSGGTGGSGDCQDQNAQCASWATQGECSNNPGWMLLHCKASCKICGGGSADDAGCRDENSNCAGWQALGECANNPVWMGKHCRKSCHTCGSDGGSSCRDSNAQCGGWASSGECQKNPGWMMVNCRKSCDNCGTDTPAGGAGCTDSAASCAFWAQSGECQKNPGWMLTNCRKSCNTCETPGTGSGDGGNTDGTCADEDVRCAGWASLGECQNNPNYMNKHCKPSCKLCQPTNTDDGDQDNNATCKDSRKECPGWAHLGECYRNPAWMALNCHVSCNTCGNTDDPSCKDGDQRCPGWATSGECAKNPNWMLSHCKKSCNTCGSPDAPAHALPPECWPEFKVDAACRGSGDVTYMFSDHQVLEVVHHHKDLAPGFPKNISDVFPNGPDNVDAAVYLPANKQTLLFQGQQMWRYTDLQLDAGYPKAWSAGTATHVDAAASEDGTHVFLVSGSDVYDWTPSTSAVAPGSPRPLRDVFVGAPDAVDAAVTGTNGTLFLFKDNMYYTLHNHNVQGHITEHIGMNWFENACLPPSL